MLRAVEPVAAAAAHWSPLLSTVSAADWLTASGLAGEVTVRCCSSLPSQLNQASLVAALKGPPRTSRTLPPACHTPTQLTSLSPCFHAARLS